MRKTNPMIIALEKNTSEEECTGKGIVFFHFLNALFIGLVWKARKIRIISVI